MHTPKELSLIDPVVRKQIQRAMVALGLAPCGQPQPRLNLEFGPSLHHTTTYAETVVYRPLSLISAEQGLFGFQGRLGSFCPFCFS